MGSRTQWAVVTGVVGCVALFLSVAVLPWTFDSAVVSIDGQPMTERQAMSLEDLYDWQDRGASDGGPVRAGLLNYLRWGVHVGIGVAVTTLLLSSGRRSPLVPVVITSAAALVHIGFAAYIVGELPLPAGAGMWVHAAGLIACAVAAWLNASASRDLAGRREPTSATISAA